MIAIILQAVTIVATLLGLAVAVGLGFAFYSSKRMASEKDSEDRARERTAIGVEGKIIAVVGLIEAYGIPKAVLQSYFEAKDALVSLLGLEDFKNQTELEIMRRIVTTDRTKLSSNEFERIYEIYERVRFGGQNISTNDVQSFLVDLREIYSNLSEHEPKVEVGE